MTYTANPNREVKNGIAKVSAKELADFKAQYGADKDLTDLLNMDKGLTRRVPKAGSKTEPKVEPKAELKDFSPSRGTTASQGYRRRIVGDKGPIWSTHPEYPEDMAKTSMVKKSGSVFDPNGAPGKGTMASQGYKIRPPGSTDTAVNHPEYPEDAQPMKKGGKVSSASSRADGIAQRGKTRGKMVMCGGGMS